MYSPGSILAAFTVAEIPFLLIASTVFNVIFYFVMGFALDVAKFFLFYMFVTFAISLFSYLGQTLVSLVRDSQTAQAMGAIVLSLTSLFSGVFIRPNEIPPFWIWIYWTFPGHWIFEGLFMSQFVGDPTVIQATNGTVFYDSLNCTPATPPENCTGTVDQWIRVNFTDFSADNIPWAALYLVLVMLITRVANFIALMKLNYRAT